MGCGNFRSGCLFGGPSGQWGSLARSQVPAVVELLFPGGESCVTGWVLHIEPAGSTWSRGPTSIFSEGFIGAEQGRAFGSV